MDSVWQMKTHLRAVMAVAVAVIAAMPTRASAQDGFTPAVVTRTVPPGGSTDVTKTLHLDPLPGFTDIIIAVDTTGSMGPAIDQAKAEAVAMCTAIKGQIAGARFAVVDFKDYQTNPEADPGDYPYLNKTPGFVADCASVGIAINTMFAAGGGDLAEAYNRVFFESYSDPTLVYNPQALKFLILIGDAPPHNPDLNPTFAPSCGFQPPIDAGRDNIAGTNDDLRTEDAIGGLVANHVNLLMVFYNTGNIPFQCYEELVVAAGGPASSAVFGGGAGTLSQQVVDEVVFRASHIDRVDLVVSQPCPLTFTFNPAPPYVNRTAPVDIEFTETITVPTTPGNYPCTVTAVVDGAERATETNDITVAGVPPMPPPCKVDIDDFDHDGIRDDIDVDDDNDGRWDNLDDDDDNDGRRDNDDDDDDNDCIKDEHDHKDRHEYEDDCEGRTEGSYGRQHRDYSIIAKPGNLVVIGVIESSKADLLWIDLYDPHGRFMARSVASPGRATVTATTTVPGVYTMRVRNRSASPITYKIALIKGMPW